MPHIREVQSTSHDRHDPMLVAALAAGDLAATDRDQAISLTRSCTDCAALHDDLLALARATAAAPPPFATPTRDFRLTPADAARLRPNPWRRLAAAIGSSPALLSRPLGVGLATLGLVGLLVGNVQVGGFMGSSASTPAPRAAGAAASEAFAPNPDMVVPPSDTNLGGGSGAAEAAASAAPTAASAPGVVGSAAGPTASGGARPAPVTAADGKTASEPPAGLAGTDADTVPSEPGRPLNLLFGAAVIVGLGILITARSRSRRTI